MIKPYPILVFIILVIFCLLISCHNYKSSQPKISNPEDTLVQIPTEWIERLKNPQSPTHKLINEFEALLYPEKKDSLVKKKGTDNLILKPTFINVDESPEKELLLWIGPAQISEFAIIKQIKGKWYLLYSQIHHTFQYKPTLIISDSLAKQTPKVFYTNHLYGHGSGFGWGKWHFFRIENDRVVTSLKVVCWAFHSIMGASIGHDVRTDIQVKNIDSINVTYHYQFILGGVSYPYLDSIYAQENDSTLMWVPFIKGKIDMRYVWNAFTKKYQLENENWQAKEKFLNNYGYTLEFYNAFELEIKQSKHPNKNEVIESLQKAIKNEKDNTKEDNQELLMLGYKIPSYYESRARK